MTSGGVVSVSIFCGFDIFPARSSTIIEFWVPHDILVVMLVPEISRSFVPLEFVT